MPDHLHNGADLAIVAISAARFGAQEAWRRLRKERGLNAQLIHINWLKPFKKKDLVIKAMRKCKQALVIDAAYETCGAAEHIAYEIMRATGKTATVLGLEDRAVGVGPGKNPTPDADRIIQKAGEICWTF